MKGNVSFRTSSSSQKGTPLRSKVQVFGGWFSSLLGHLKETFSPGKRVNGMVRCWLSRHKRRDKEGERRRERKRETRQGGWRRERRDKERRKRLVLMRRSCCRVTRVKQPFYRLPVGVSCTHVHPRPRCSLCTSAEILIHPQSPALSFFFRVTGSWNFDK